MEGGGGDGSGGSGGACVVNGFVNRGTRGQKSLFIVGGTINSNISGGNSFGGMDMKINARCFVVL